MAEMAKDFFLGMPVGLYIILILVFLLLVASWIVPPLGVISASSLQGAALILGATWLMYVTVNIPRFIESGAKIKASYGNAQIEIGRKNEAILDVRRERSVNRHLSEDEEQTDECP